MAFISVIIVNYNSGNRLHRCLDALEAQSFRDFETIIADNGSTDGSEATGENRNVSTRLLKLGENLGFAAANNRAAEIAKGEWLVFLNPDAYARSDWLSAFSSASKQYPEIDAFGATQLDAENPDTLDGAGDVYHALGLTYRAKSGHPANETPPDHDCFSACAAAMMIRKSRFDELNGFDERFFCYGEDVDLGFRLRLAGRKIMQLQNAVVLHEGSGVTGRFSEFTVYHGNRNRIWLTHKNMPTAIYWWLGPAQLIANLALMTRYARIGCARAYCRALIDGYGGLASLHASRRSIQQHRKTSASEIAGAMTWSLGKIFRREGRHINAS